jgi:hypothetical protein
MSQRGKPSTAHVYDKRDQCIHCGMYRINVEKMNHDCTQAREAEEDRKTDGK